MPSRREFLKLSALVSASALTPGFLRRLGPGQLPPGSKRLVIIQLSGGNDGLNTIVPFRDDRYYQARPALAIPAGEVLRISDELAFNPALAPLRELYDQGWMSILSQVGYPNPDRSHFRSMDIWHSASGSGEHWQTGWLGRYLDAACAAGAPAHTVLELDETLSLALRGEQISGLGLRDPQQLARSTRDPWIQALSRTEPQGPSELDFLYKTLTQTTASAEYLSSRLSVRGSAAEYPAQELGRKLKLIASLILSGAEPRVYYVSVPGFDTHVRQRGPHDRLLGQYAEAVAAFIRDLRQQGLLDDTLVLTFSEFGRRVAQNAGNGTDHGKANCLFLMGGKLRKPGLFNGLPDLRTLDDGDLAWQIDFRQIYASLLRDWLGADDEAVLRGRFGRLALV